MYLACSALGVRALAAAPAPQARDDGARAQASTQQQSNSHSRRNNLVKIVRQATGRYYQQPVALAESDGYQLLGVEGQPDRHVRELAQEVRCDAHNGPDK